MRGTRKRLKMSKIVINAEPRVLIGKQVNQLRRQGKLPAVVYGHKVDPKPITLDLRDATKILSTTTSTSLITLVLEGKEFPSIVREKQIDFILGTLKHVDFQAVSLTEKIRAEVAIHFEGESPAIKEFDAILTSGLTHLLIEGLPQDLPETIIVNVSKLRNVGDTVLVKDIEVSDNVEILSHSEEMVVMVTSSKPLSEEPEGEGDELLDSSGEPEIIDKGKKEKEDF